MRLVREGVRPIFAVADEVRPIRRALIAYSGSMESAKTMKRFVQLRLWPDLKLRIVTFGDDQESAEGLLSEAAQYCRIHGYDPEIEYLPGSSKSELLLHADAWDADVIVIGSSARRLLRHRLFGETALSVIRDSARPLFLAQ